MSSQEHKFLLSLCGPVRNAGLTLSTVCFVKTIYVFRLIRRSWTVSDSRTKNVNILEWNARLQPPFDLGWVPDPAQNDHSTILGQREWSERFGRKSVADVHINSRTEKMFPSHMSVNDLGVFAVVMVFGLIVVLLFMFDFVSKLWLTSFVLYGTACMGRSTKNHLDREKPHFHTR